MTGGPLEDDKGTPGLLACLSRCSFGAPEARRSGMLVLLKGGPGRQRVWNEKAGPSVSVLDLNDEHNLSALKGARRRNRPCLRIARHPFDWT